YLVALAMLTLGSVWCVSGAYAIPAFARKYQTSCATCHYAFPKLNYFGRAFRNNGYRYPEGADADVTKEQPVKLGAAGYKKMFPRSLWPSDMPGTIPLSMRAVLRANRHETSRNGISTFEFPHEVEFLTAGTLGETFSFFGETEIENEDNENELGTSMRLQYDPKPWLHFRAGDLSPQPIMEHLRLTAAHYNAYSTRNTPSSLTLMAVNPNDPTGPMLSIGASTSEARWRFRDDQSGVEIWGAHNGPNGNGGLTWATGVVNGQGRNDANGRKDVYARVAWKFGGYGELGGGEARNDSKFWRDDSFKIGAFYYTGSATNAYSGSMLALDPTDPTGVVDVSASATIVNDFDVVGGNFDLWIKDLNLFGVFLSQSDDNPLGTGEGIDTNAWFAEANYVFYPWLIGILRYGETDLNFDVQPDPDTQQFLVPAVTFMLRANVKLTVEAQLRLDDPAGNGKDKYVAALDFSF
ncbi:MAG: hypothetical protein ACE5ID_00905, partial [Acidobacteriota bacterium]